MTKYRLTLNSPKVAINVNDEGGESTDATGPSFALVAGGDVVDCLAPGGGRGPPKRTRPRPGVTGVAADPHLQAGSAVASGRSHGGYLWTSVCPRHLLVKKSEF